ncbi:hypothetical protein DL93DRAFT_2088462 [Clavulina sp. PMI_390]|nr:hypothetical protein DL93DRAFT_2088462 [Clavulina sp. PMI_390]
MPRLKVERGASSTSGLAPHLADEDILTPWPTRSLTLGPRIDEMRHHISLVERGLPLEIPFCPGSFPALVLPSQTESLFSTTGKYTAARVIAGDTSLSLRTKGMAFLERATYLAVRTSAGDFSSHSPSNSATADGPAIPGNEMMRPPASIGDCAPIDTSRLRNDFFQKFNDLDLALNTFHESLPPLRPEDFSTEVSTGPKVGADCGCDIDSSEEEFYDMEGGWAPIRSARTHSLVATNLLVLGATIQLHSILSESRPESHEAMLRAAMRVCELTAIISQQNPRNIILGGTLSMFISGRVIIREFQHVHDPTLSRGSPVSHNHEPQVLEHMLDAFRAMMQGYRRILDFYEVIIVLASLPWLHSTDVYPDSLVADLEKLGLRL